MNELRITRQISVPLSEVEIQAVRSQGPGGQHVNKAATAIQLRFDIRASSLSDFYKQRLLRMHDHRITKSGDVVIKAQTHRSQEQNREEALERLRALLRDAGHTRKKRLPTRPSRRQREQRLEDKARRARIKSLREKPDPD